MARIAVLVARDASGKLSAVDVAEGDGISELLSHRLKIREDAGVVQKGQKAVSLAELYTLSTHTTGGELKARLTFKT